MNRPMGITAKGRFKQWVYDSINSLRANQAPGFLKSETTRGTFLEPLRPKILPAVIEETNPYPGICRVVVNLYLPPADHFPVIVQEINAKFFPARLVYLYKGEPYYRLNGTLTIPTSATWRHVGEGDSNLPFGGSMYNNGALTQNPIYLERGTVIDVEWTFGPVYSLFIPGSVRLENSQRFIEFRTVPPPTLFPDYPFVPDPRTGRTGNL